MKETNSNFISHGCHALSNHGGFEIELSDDGERARLKYYNDKPSRWQNIKINSKGSYVTFHGMYYYLSEFLKVESLMKHIYLIIRENDFTGKSRNKNTFINKGYVETLERAREITTELTKPYLEGNKTSPVKVKYYYQKINRL